MSVQAAYESPDVRLSGELDVAARFNLRNVSGAAWRPAEGFAAGYHIYDSDTGTLVVDGERHPPPGDVAPGGFVPVDLHFALPPEPGRYDVYISPMREDVCWFYTVGWPFLRVEAIVEDGRARLERVGVVTLRTIRRENFLRAMGRAFTLPVSTIAHNLSLIRTMVRRDILGRYRGSFGGIFWTVLNPLLLMLTYFFVFGVVLKARFGSDPSRAGFALYFLAGMLPWLAFSEAAGRAPTVMMEHRNFVKKLVFAVETLPINLVVSGLVTEVFALLLFALGCLLGARGSACIGGLAAGADRAADPVYGRYLLVPRSAGRIRARSGTSDRLPANAVVLPHAHLLSGDIAARGSLPLLTKNPMFVLVRGYRAIFLEGHAPLWGSLWKLWIASAAVFILGHAWFYKLRRSFADII